MQETYAANTVMLRLSDLAPDDATMMSLLLSLESQGNGLTVTLKVFTYEEATKIIGNLS